MLADGTSDEPIAVHIAAMARSHGVELDIVVPDFARLHRPPGRTVHARLGRLLEIDNQFDLLIVHRDAEAQTPELRVAEISTACDARAIAWPRIPVVPVRMTEAWLLLDEQAIRLVAGKPTGRQPLALPAAADVERLPDPKAALQQVLKTASGLAGRRLKEFKRDFPSHRRQLLERIDRQGPVSDLSAWRALERATQSAVETFLPEV